MTEQTGKSSPINSIALDDERTSMRGLYLDDRNDKKRLVSVSEQYRYSYSEYFWYWYESASYIDVYDLSTPATSIEKKASIVIDGQYISSRKIGSKLYVISQYSARLDGYVRHPYTQEEVSQNYKLVNDASIEDLLPRISVNGESSVMIDNNDCYIPGVPEDAIQPTLALVTVIDLDGIDESKPNEIPSSCIAAPISTIYASLNAVYMVENEYLRDNQDSRYISHIYKMDLGGDEVKYEDRVSLKGNVGWNQQFRLSEYQGYLRVVTTDRSASENNIHRLHSVEITESGLELAATIPNENDSTPIGKPGESIYSVRFNNEKAYVVTFRQIDPFYVIDLSNPVAPKVAGELELPGFSNYLHPFGDNLVFGLGRGADNGMGTDQIKVALFDVSDMSQPQLVNDVVLEGDRSYTPALYSHTALSILPSSEGDSWRLGFSASIYESWEWQKDAYYLFEINEGTESESAGIKLAGELIGSDNVTGINGRYYYSSYDRGVITGTHVHYSHNNSLITERWDNLSISE